MRLPGPVVLTCRAVVLTCCALVLAGCASAPAPAPATTPPAAPAPVAAPTGRVGFQVVADPSVDNALADRQEFVVPRPVDPPLAKPPYPADALAAGAAGVVGVRITIDPDGAVTTVEDSPVVPGTPGPFAAAFRAAVEGTVRRWRFSGGRVELLEDGKDLDDDGKPDYTRVVQSVPVSVFYDVRFEFTIVDGAPRVQGGVP